MFMYNDSIDSTTEKEVKNNGHCKKKKRVFAETEFTDENRLNTL
jgi:hypothetical protein